MSRGPQYNQTTNRTVLIHPFDTSGNDLTTLVYNTSGLVVEYRRSDQSSWTAITLVTATVGTYASGGFVHDSQGDYELGLPAGAYATTAQWVAVRWRGAASLKTGRLLIPLWATNLQGDATRGGMTALPNANASASNGLPTLGTGTGQIDLSSGRVNAGKWVDTAIPAPSTAGVPRVDVRYVNGNAPGVPDGWLSPMSALGSLNANFNAGDTALTVDLTFLSSVNVGDRLEIEYPIVGEDPHPRRFAHTITDVDVAAFAATGSGTITVRPGLDDDALNGTVVRVWRAAFPFAATGERDRVTANAVLNATQPAYAPAKAGDAMALTGAYDAAKTAASATLVNAVGVIATSAANSAAAAATSAASADGKLTTALARLGAWTGTGVNNLLGAFKALLSKVASMPSDVGGTGDPATDSNEALAEAVAALGTGSGTGAYTVTVTVTDGTIPLQNATVRYTEGSNSYTATTDASGVATFALDAATYAVAVTKAGYTLAPTTHAVAGTTSRTYAMTAINVTPAAAGQTTGYLTTVDGQGAAQAGVAITFRMASKGTAGLAWQRVPFTATSDGSGLLQVALAQSTVYQAKRADGDWETFTTGTNATYQLPEVLSQNYGT